MGSVASLVAPAVRALREGKVVLYPTDTLLGLAVRPQDPRALARLFEVKRRPEGAPVSLALSSLEEVEPVATLSLSARQSMRELLPGPYTMLVRPSARSRSELPRGVLGPTGLLAVRIPDHPLARELSRQAGPITSTSANLHGAPPLRTAAAARRVFGRGVAVYLPAVPSPSGVPSQLLDLSGPVPRPVARG